MPLSFCMCVLCVFCTGWVLEDWRQSDSRSLFSHTFQHLGASGPNIIINEHFLSIMVLKRKPLCPAECFGAVKLKRMTNCCGQTPIHHLSPWWEQFPLCFFSLTVFSFLAPLCFFFSGFGPFCVQFNKTIHLHFILAINWWDYMSKICFNLFQWRKLVKVLFCSLSPTTPPSWAPLFSTCWLFPFCWHCGLCGFCCRLHGVSVNLCFRLCPWLFSDQKHFHFSNPKTEPKGTFNVRKWPLDQLNIKMAKSPPKKHNKKWEGMLSFLFLRQFLFHKHFLNFKGAFWCPKPSLIYNPVQAFACLQVLFE